jgi:hypothetical protein
MKTSLGYLILNVTILSYKLCFGGDLMTQLPSALSPVSLRRILAKTQKGKNDSQIKVHFSDSENYIL